MSIQLDGKPQWKEVSRERVFDKYRKIDKLVCEDQDGRVEEFFISAGGPAAAVLALTPDNKILLAKQYRFGPGKVLMELPGGGIGDGEDVLEGARRELLEETGYAGEMEYVGSLFGNAWSSIENHYFVARNCQKVAEQSLDPVENVEVTSVSLDEFRRLLRNGQMTDVGGGYMCLDYLRLL